jgi:phosphoesterase RecJ-like protein
LDYLYILNKIKEYDKIIIHRHERPDLDALGSQYGLKEVILENFPNKEVYCVGDGSKFIADDQIDLIDDEVYEEALVFVVDVAVIKLLADKRAATLAKDVIVIDHHTNLADIPHAVSYIDESYEAAAAYLADILFSLDLKINAKAAHWLFSGIVTDSGRFQYLKNGERLFKIVSKLVKYGADPQKLYNELYQESLEERRLKSEFQVRMEISEGIAFLKNNKEILEKYPNHDPFQISRGMVNLMAGITGVPIWLNFTYNFENGKILGEFRSRGIKIVEIAKKYGGGGHDNACGALLNDWDEVSKVIEDFKKLLKLESEK